MTGEDSDPGVDGITPLEDRAFFDIDAEDGYVRIDQSVGDPPLYTPEEARDIAAEIRDVADGIDADAGTPE